MEALRKDLVLLASIFLLILFSLFVLSSLAPDVFPKYFLFIFVGLVAFFVFSQADFELLRVFSPHFYTVGIFFLILPLIIGEVTRGVVRWVPIGAFSVQPAEIARPFILLFLAYYWTSKELNLKNFFLGTVYSALPVFLILLQPSLGVAAVTLVGIGGLVLALGFNKKILLPLVVLGAVALPLLWSFMAPYQRARLAGFISQTDPSGAGYNSIQSTISVGSGQLFGRGLGQGVQTQLLFLPEKQTDFIFASTAEELGFAGGVVLLVIIFVLLYRLALALYQAKGYTERALAAGIFISIFTQTTIHIGMNVGLLPITGLPLPLVSVGGSSFLGTMIFLGMSYSLRR